MMRSWWQKLVQPRSWRLPQERRQTPSGRRRSFRPRLEALEERELLATFVVDRIGDAGFGMGGVGTGLAGDLRYCITRANAQPGENHTITFSITGNINLDSPLPALALPAPHRLTIRGPGVPSLLRVQPQFFGTHHIFQVNAGTTVDLFNLQISGGKALEGGGIRNSGTLTVSNVILSANQATSAGGAVWNGGMLTVSDGSILRLNSAESNTGTFFGGGIYNASGGTVEVINSTLEDGRARATQNGRGFGGGIYNTSGGRVTVITSTLARNWATPAGGSLSSEGGGIYNASGGTVTVTGSTLSANGAVFGGGGGIYSQGTLTVTGSTLSANQAGSANGGGIHNSMGNATVANSTLRDNFTERGATDTTGVINGYGGGIYNASGTLAVIGSTLSGNRAGLPPTAPTYGGDGGGIYTATGTVSVINSTLHGNLAARRFDDATSAFSGRGAGIYNAAGTVTITNGTVTANAAGTRGGGIWNGGTLNVRNTIVAQNSAPAGSELFGSVTTGGYNLIGGDPRLGPLQNNGGPTLTRAPLPGSPALDTGDPAFTPPPATDQRGLPRVFNSRIDIGAYERGPSMVFTTDDSGPGSLRAALADGNDYAEVRFAPGLGGQVIGLTSGSLNVTRSLTITGLGANNLTVRRTSATPFGIFTVAGGATVTISGLTIANGSTSSGGGIYSFGALTVRDSALVGNTASGNGGGIRSLGTLTVNNSTLSGNSAGSGGGIFTDGALTVVNNSTLAGNTASGQGGGIWEGGLLASGTLSINNSTLAGNTAGGQGGGIFTMATASNPSYIGSTIVARNDAATARDVSGSVTSQGFNLIGRRDGSSGWLTAGPTPDLTGTIAAPLDPLLGPTLQDNGGPTLTLALLPGSPALDAGDPTLIPSPAADQRGFPRVFNGRIDSGAYERQPSVVTTTNDGGPGSLRSALADNNDYAEVRFAPGLSGQVIGLTTGALSITRSLTVAGLGANSLTVRRSSATPFRIFTVTSSATVLLSGLTIANGNSGSGGGISNHGTLTVSHSTLAGNSAVQGGGISNRGILTVSHSTVTGNSAGLFGGGIENFGTLTVSYSTLAGNSASAPAGTSYTSQGGGILNGNTGQLAVSHSTLAGNSADNQGGGISNYGTATLAHSTLASNFTTSTSSQGGGIYNTNTSTLSARNTILAGNTAPTDPDLLGSLTSGAYNLIGGNPLLGPLQDNGGPTETMALLPDSPALDAGDPNFTPPPASDQRGLTRVVAGRIDIGAVEVQTGAATSFTVAAPADVTAGVPFSVTVTARDAYGHVATGYTGTVTFNSTDPQAFLPSDYTFGLADQGARTFTITPGQAGPQTVTVTDTASATVTGTASLTVTPGALASFAIAPDSGTVTAGVPFDLYVFALDAYGNVITDHAGEIGFSSSDPLAGLPAPYTFQPADAGVAYFAGGVVFGTPGTQELFVFDTATGTVFGYALFEVMSEDAYAAA